MPLYEFKCKKCKYKLDIIISYDERKVKQDCPKCKKKHTFLYQDKIHKSSYKLKGTGWYETDHKHK